MLGIPTNIQTSQTLLAHVISTGPEIWRQTKGEITHFVATMGTGGTISGCAKALKISQDEEGKKHPKVIGVDAIGSILKEYFEDGTIGKPWHLL